LSGHTVLSSRQAVKMQGMASLQTLERRIIAVDLKVGKILEHLGLASATDDEIDTAMDAE
jgi:hypothetical protein